MATLDVFDNQGRAVGKYEIDPGEIAPRISRQLLHDVVVMYQNNLRQGSNKTKTRGEVAGSTRKMYRQKGTGNARAGSRRSGIRRGGGHINARQPRDYSYRLPRKAVQLATRMAIASKIMDGQVVVLESLKFDVPATKSLATTLKSLNLGGSALVATQTHDVNVYKSGRNIAGVSVLPVSDLNAFEVLRPDRLVVTKGALDAIKAKAAEALASRKAPAASGA